jgi:hypothetical protein
MFNRRITSPAELILTSPRGGYSINQRQYGYRCWTA